MVTLSGKIFGVCDWGHASLRHEESEFAMSVGVFGQPTKILIAATDFDLAVSVPSVIVRTVLPFRVNFRPGISIHEQVFYAAKKAMVARQLRPGDIFPSVRALSKELRINPNTAHKVVTRLIAEGLLETRPGVGCTVASLPEATTADRTQLLGQEVEQLVVEAKKLGIELKDVLSSIAEHWQRLGGQRSPERGGRDKR
jgi:GntR family transcriptional regulator